MERSDQAIRKKFDELLQNKNVGHVKGLQGHITFMQAHKFKKDTTKMKTAVDKVGDASALQEDVIPSESEMQDRVLEAIGAISREDKGQTGSDTTYYGGKYISEEAGYVMDPERYRLQSPDSSNSEGVLIWSHGLNRSKFQQTLMEVLSTDTKKPVPKEKREVDEALRYQISWPKFEVMKTPSVLVRDWHKPEQYVDTKILTSRAAKTAAEIASQYEPEQEPRGRRAPWRDLLKLPQLKEMPTFPVTQQSVRESHRGKVLRVPKTHVHGEDLQPLDRARKFLRVIMEETEKIEDGRKPTKKVGGASDTHKVMFAEQWEEEPRKKQKSKKVRHVEPALKKQEQKLKQIRETTSKRRKKSVERIKISSSDRMKWGVSSIVHSESEDSVDFENKITGDYLKKLVEESPSLVSGSEPKDKGEATPTSDEFFYTVNKAAEDIFKTVTAGDMMDADIVTYLCLTKSGEVDCYMLDEVLSRIEGIDKIEAMLQRKLNQVIDMEDMRRWDENYIDNLNNYLKNRSEFKNASARRVSILQEALKHAELTESELGQSILEPDYCLFGNGSHKFSMGCETGDLRVDQSVLYKPKPDTPSETSIVDEGTKIRGTAEVWCPRASFVYSNTEDLEPLTTILSFNKERNDEFYSFRSKYELSPEKEDPYDEELAEIKYLKSKPTCFIILGKQGTESRRLAEKIVSYWGCILIDPDSEVLSALNSGSNVGNWMQSLLRKGDKIPSFVTFSLILQRLYDNDVCHYGYVLTGLPYSVRSDKDPSATHQLRTIFNMPLKPDIIVYIMCPDQDIHYKRHQQRFHPSTNSYVSKDLNNAKRKVRFLYVHDKGKDSHGHVREILEEFDKEMKLAELLLKNDIVMRQNDSADLVATELQLYRQETLQAIQNIVLQFDPQYVIKVDGRATPMRMFQIVRAKLLVLPVQRLYTPQKVFPNFPISPKASDLSAVDESEERDEDLEEEKLSDEDVLGVYYPTEEEINMEELLWEKLDEALPEEEEELEEEEPDTQLDEVFKSRAESDQTSEFFPLTLDDIDEEDESVAFLADKTMQECYHRLSNKNAIGEKFRWHLSHWNFTCPVALVQGRAIQGLSQFAVRFLDKLYFLSSPYAQQLFMENPRPYLVPPNPVPACRYFIMGPRLVGKTTLAMYLAKMFHGKVISFKQLCEQTVAEKREEILKAQREVEFHKAINVVTEERRKEYEENEEERLHHVDEWKGDMKYLLNELIDLSTSRESSPLSRDDSISSDREPQSKGETISSASSKHTPSEIRELLDMHHFPRFDSIRSAESILQNIDNFVEFLPENLRNPATGPPIVDETDPLVVKYVGEAVNNYVIDPPLTVNTDEVAFLLAQAIDDVEKQRAEATEGAFRYGGWIVDDVPPDAEFFKKIKDYGVSPDEIICLRDESYEEGDTSFEEGTKIPDYSDLIRAQFPSLRNTDYSTDKDIELSKPRNHIFLSILDLSTVSNYQAEDVLMEPALKSFISRISVFLQEWEQTSLDVALEAFLKSEDPNSDVLDNGDTGYERSIFDSAMEDTSTASLVDQEFQTGVVEIEEEDLEESSYIDVRKIDSVGAPEEDVYSLRQEYECMNILEIYGTMDEERSLSIICSDWEHLDAMLNSELVHGSRRERTSSVSIHRRSSSILKTSQGSRQLKKHSQVKFSLEEVIFNKNNDKEQIEKEGRATLDDMTKELQLFNAAYEIFKQELGDASNSIVEMNVFGKNTADVLEAVMTRVEDMFRMKPEPLEAEEEAEEEKEEEEFGEELGEETEHEPLVKHEGRVDIGDTKTFCPVRFTRDFALWPGSKELAVMFQNKRYWLSDPDAREEFLQNPRSFAPYKNPPKTFPPTRICIVGPIGSGKSALAQFLSRRLGIPYVNYRDLVDNILIAAEWPKVGRKHEDSHDFPREEQELDESGKFLQEVRMYLDEGAALSENSLQQILKPLWTSRKYCALGFILDGFPHGREDIAFMVKFVIVPDVIVELQVSEDVARDRVYENYILNWRQKLKENQRKFIEEVVRASELRDMEVWSYALSLLAQRKTKSEETPVAAEPEEKEPAISPQSSNKFDSEEKLMSVISRESLEREQSKSGSKITLQETKSDDNRASVLKYHVVIENKPVSYVFDEEGKPVPEHSLPLETVQILQSLLIKEASKRKLSTEDSEKLIQATEPTMEDRRQSPDTIGKDYVDYSQRDNYLPSIAEDSTSSTEEDSESTETAQSSVIFHEAVENLTFVSIEELLLWFENQENKTDISNEIAEIVDTLYPPPAIERDWESAADAKERLEEDIGKWFQTESDTMETLREVAGEHNIPWHQLQAEGTSEEVLHSLVFLTNQCRYKSESMFESTYEVTVEEGEKLINHGYYFVSKFGFWCPVQVAEKEIPVQMYLSNENRLEIYPIVHRQFIYFTVGLENKKKFCKDPLKYIRCDPYCPLFPVRVAIIGPPKCGKSNLAHRLAQHFGLKVITIGHSIRYVLEDLCWTQLANQIDSVLREGMTVPDKLIMKAVEAASLDPRCATQGMILDGFPNTVPQMQELSKHSLLPFLIISLQCNSNQCVDNTSSMQNDNFRIGFKYSDIYMISKYKEWVAATEAFFPWVQSEYQNMVQFDASNSRGWLFYEAKKEIFRIMKTIISYLKNVNQDAVPLQYLCVSSDEFNSRRNSNFEDYCPVCLKEGVMTVGTCAERRGLVQYKNFFYWICKDHFASFVADPLTYTPPCNVATIPSCVPESTDLEENQPTDQGSLFADGYCVVTYLTKNPYGRLVKGSASIAAKYKNKVYLFCSDECRGEFMKTPDKYSDVQIHFRNTEPLPPLSLATLPPMGYLEQTLYSMIKSGLSFVTYKRPKYPRLDAQVSAAICLGLYLKVHNVKLPVELLTRYEASNTRFHDTLAVVKTTLDILSTVPNMYTQQTPQYPSAQDIAEDGSPAPSTGHKSASEHSSLSSEYGPCGYVYKTQQQDFYLGDYYMELSGCDSSYDSLQDSMYEPSTHRLHQNCPSFLHP